MGWAKSRRPPSSRQKFKKNNNFPVIVKIRYEALPDPLAVIRGGEDVKGQGRMGMRREGEV